ncbi:MAG TPA: non-ribosomal peptide synthetase, partial [Eubacterium sp.]|nr:non-ribosomal peptide synthetase [Eubacterium sp.]
TDTAKFLKLLKNQKVTVLNQVPTAFYNLDYEDKGEDLCVRYLIFGGEALDPTKLRGWKEKHPETKIINMYGITETTVHVTYREIGEEEIERGISDIGKAIPTLSVYIMNGDTMCGIGMPGELCVTGEGLAKGYLNRPELTAEKFVKNPFWEGRMYRSGDLARWLPDGNIEYLGRIDEQVKIRGFRIELGEIESRIRDIEEIRDAAVIVGNDGSGNKAIFAYFVVEDGKKTALSDIREKLSVNLPDYMIPAYMMQIEKIPVTKNGKLDRRSLPVIKAKTEKEYIEPRNEAEKAVCKAFAEILNAEKVGVKDSFYELGGDSIKAIRIISKLRNLGYTVTVKDIMNGKTVEKIAVEVKTRLEETKYEQGEVVGMVEPTPIIKEFFGWNLLKPWYFNQSMMFMVDGIDNVVIRQAVEEIVKHHDMLRVVCRDNLLEILSINESKLFDFYEFDYSNEKDKHKSVDEKCTEIQGSIDLENGPIVKVAVFELGETKQMMICIHHLAVDGVSWRIISEDFEDAVNQIEKGKKVILPEKTASFIEWGKKLNEYEKKLGIREKIYWKKVNDEIVEGKISTDYSDGELGFSIVQFSNETTEKLLTKSSNAYGAKIDEVLIAGLARAVGRITGQKKLAIKNEGHGREEIHESISIDRTVGWFTNIYALCVDVSEDNATAIVSAKDVIRGIPNNGMGYAYVNHEVLPDVTFNYLGEFKFNQTDDEEIWSTGEDIASDNKNDDAILVNGGTYNGVLSFMIKSNNSDFGKKFISRLAEEFENAVIELSEYCSLIDKNETMTNSDLSDDTLDNDELDYLNSLID